MNIKIQLTNNINQLLPRLSVKSIESVRVSDLRYESLLVKTSTPLGAPLTLRLLIIGQAIPSRIRDSLRALKSSSTPDIEYPMLASTFLSPRVKEVCQEEHVGYLDLAGNCFIQTASSYFEKIVDRNPFPQRGRPVSLFGPVSSRIIRALLQEPDKKWSVIDLSHQSGVSLGQSSNVTKRLREQEYLSLKDRRLVLKEPARLLDEWANQYDPNPKNFHGYYSFEKDPQRLIHQIEDEATKHKWQYALTSFSGAMLVAPFVRGINTIQWYIEDESLIIPWVNALDLRPVSSGPNVILRIPYDRGVFYKTQSVEGSTLAGNIQLYLDLLREPSRGKEQAEFLRKERIGF